MKAHARAVLLGLLLLVGTLPAHMGRQPAGYPRFPAPQSPRHPDCLAPRHPGARGPFVRAEQPEGRATDIPDANGVRPGCDPGGLLFSIGIHHARHSAEQP